MYPSDLVNDQELRSKGIDHRKIFIAMPFAKEYDALFNNLIVPAVKKANDTVEYIEEHALYSYRAKDDTRTTSGWINILTQLYTAQIVMGILTSDNPNVFYELGIAHAIQPITRQILIATRDYKPRFDLKDLIYYEYDENDLDSCVEPLSNRIVDAIRSYKIEKDKKIRQARMSIGPYDFDVIMRYGGVSNFFIKTNDYIWRATYETQHGIGSLERHVEGMKNLCQNNMLGLNTASRSSGGTTEVEVSYYWTSLGNDVLNLLRIIDENEVKTRGSKLPEFFD